MNYLLDTNVISELRKGERCDAGVKAWFEETDDESLFLSVLVIGELRRGVESIRRRDPLSANHLDLWLGNILDNYSERIIDIDRKITETWGRMNALRPLPVIDGLLAATAKTYAFILVTRNIKDIQHTDALWLNPFI